MRLNQHRFKWLKSLAGMREFKFTFSEPAPAPAYTPSLAFSAARNSMYVEGM